MDRNLGTDAAQFNPFGLCYGMNTKKVSDRAKSFALIAWLNDRETEGINQIVSAGVCALLPYQIPSE